MYAAANGGGGSILPGLLIGFAITVAYWAPSIVAVWRRVPNTGSVVVINLLLAWTVIGWIVALAMACRSKPRLIQPAQGYYPPQPQPGYYPQGPRP
jgi:hypothetical protein